ncbi:MAG: hypothetical protein R3D78_11440 [Paracoccaceae bacterium]|jgi:hypothetical protein
MRTPLFAMLALSVALSGCGWMQTTKLNPFNWFGSSTEEATTLEPEGGYQKAIGDNRIPVAQVTRLEAKQTSSGVVISAAGLPPTQGYWDAELVPSKGLYPIDGVMTYTFVVAEPATGSPAAGRVMTPESREVTAATYLTNTRLQEVRKIVVESAGNARSISR